MQVVIFDGFTQEKPYGWVCFVNSVIHQETPDFQDLLVGGGPLIVRRATGEHHAFGSGCTLKMYEAGTIPYDTRVDMDDDATL
ncbi:YrhB domain-containing protein [Deinococcus koreensis]|uniref:Uncharacterized protein n=1 Tax=Deinococcus koreensis TaxID=2054903 RepID=A0A2K3UXG5_9DEIO|nr:YrhB domain-containing protein [Deinococcus koreensis]PNY81231.1 hypothetical protein CVO96_07405 [Deinococcus koreensis]